VTDEELQQIIESTALLEKEGYGMSVRRELIAEVQRLRDENARLRGLLGKTAQEMLDVYERYNQE